MGQLQLLEVSYRAGTQPWLYPMDLTLNAGVNVLLGATLAGKTTALRLMAGLERPTTGRIVMDGRDVTALPVRQRNLAMVYQQFINYPSLTVYENIASPLRLARQPAVLIKQRVLALAETLRLTPFLERRPAELSGGQQQRTALARALAKDAELLLLDEPLVNLDYKLREELRDELRALFAQGRSTVVYATTEPQEALQLGGHCAVLAEGRLIQCGGTLGIFRRPATLQAARAFSDPPLNELHASLELDAGAAILAGGARLPLTPRTLAVLGNSAREVVLGIRAHQLSATARAGTAAISGRVELAEISGSQTYLHVAGERLSLIAQLPGVHDFALGAPCTLHVDPADVYCFDAHGQLLCAPE
jgi:glycerol transport system ATP-binding protein